MPYLDERNAFLLKKNLNPNMFEDKILLSAPIKEHAAWAFRHIYSKPYPKSNQTDTNQIARPYHGMPHISRAAIYVPVFANLYRKYNDEGALHLTNDDIKLLQIAALLHDSAREGDGEDLWDDESGTLVFYYLTYLGVEENKALLIAEAVANKDIHDGGYHQLSIQDQKPTWTLVDARPKNIYQKLIQCADCLDISRARDYFDANYLDFYKDIASKNIEDSFNEMAHLILESKNFLALHGDCRVQPDLKIKKLLFETEDGFANICLTLDKNNDDFPILSTLYHDGVLLAAVELAKSLIPSYQYDPKKGLDEENIKAAMYEGKLFARGIGIPTGIGVKQLTPNHLTDTKSESCQMTLNNEVKETCFDKMITQDNTNKSLIENTKLSTEKPKPSTANTKPLSETLTAIELRKIKRRYGVPTTSSKANRDQKEGNPNRSISMLGYGAGVFSNIFYLIVNPNIDDFTSISPIDADTGWQKKPKFNATLHTTEEKGQKLNELLRTIKMGGSAKRYRRYNFPATHTELTCNIKEVHAVGYTQDPTLRNIIDTNKTAEPFHRFSPYLQAVFLQNEYEKTYGKRPPIFQYSGLHGFISKEEEITRESLINKWRIMCSDYMSTQFNECNSIINLVQQPISYIKLKAMYGITQPQQTSLLSKLEPGDINYPIELQEAISNEIEKEKRRLINQQNVMTQVVYDIAAGDLDALKQKCEVVTDRVTWDNNPHTVMMITAIASQQIKILRFLLEESPDKNIFLNTKSDTSGKTPLHHAVNYLNAEMVKILLDAGADINALDNNNMTPLDYAIELGNDDLIKPLSENKIDMSTLSEDKKERYLISAIKTHNKELFQWVLDKGVNLNLNYAEDISFILGKMRILDQTKRDDLQLSLQSMARESLQEPDTLISYTLPSINVSSEINLTPLNVSSEINLTPLQLAVLVRSPILVRKLLENGAQITEFPVGFAPLDLAILLEHKRIQALLILHSPKDLDAYIQAKKYDFIFDLNEEDEIEKIVENKVYMGRIYKWSTYYAQHLIDPYVKRTGKPIDLGEQQLDLIRALEAEKFLDMIKKGQIIGFKKDCGRYVTRSTSFHTSGDSRIFKDKDLSLFSFDGWHISGFNLSGSTWSFHETDTVVFNKCILDNVHLASGSNINNIIFRDPIFSSTEQAYRFAQFYQIIPPFILDIKYFDIFNTLIAEGKKIDLSVPAVLEKIITIIENNEFELFQKIWPSIDFSQKQILKLIKAAVKKIDDWSFINLIYAGNINTFSRFNNQLLRHAMANDNVRMMNFLLGNNANASDLLKSEYLFSALIAMFQEKFPSVEINPVLFSEKVKKMKKAMLSDQLAWLYALINKWIHIYAHTKNNESDAAQHLYQLLVQLKSIYTDFMEGNDITKAIDGIKAQYTILLDKLIKEGSLDDKAKDYDLSSYLDIYVKRERVHKNENAYRYWYVMKISDKQLTDNDIVNICHYLKQNPHITALDISHNALTTKHLKLLLTIPTINSIDLSHNKIDDEGAYLLAQVKSIKSIFLKGNELISLNGIKAIKSNLNFENIFLSSKKSTPEEKELWKSIINEENLFKRIDYGKQAGLNPSIPSLQKLSLFAATQKASKDRSYYDQLKVVKKSLIKR